MGFVFTFFFPFFLSSFLLFSPFQEGVKLQVVQFFPCLALYGDGRPVVVDWMGRVFSCLVPYLKSVFVGTGAGFFFYRLVFGNFSFF